MNDATNDPVSRPADGLNPPLHPSTVEPIEREPIERIREVPEAINDGIDMVRRNRDLLSRPFFLRLLLPILLGQLLMTLFYEQAVFILVSDYSFVTSPYFSSGSDSLDILLAALGLILLILGSIWGIALYNALVCLELDAPWRDDEERRRAFAEYFGEFRTTATASSLGIGMIVVVAIFVSAIILAIPIAGRIYLLGLIFLIPFFLVRFSLYFPTRLIEDTPFLESFSRSSRLVTGAWWQTFGLILCGAMITALLSMAGYMPTLVIGMLGEIGLIPTPDMTSGIGLVVTTLLGLLYGTGQALGLVTSLFLALYFIGRREAKEGTALIGELERLGGREVTAADDRPLEVPSPGGGEPAW